MILERRCVHALAAGLAVLAACDGDGASEGASAPPEVPVWSAELELRIGSLDDPEYALTRITALEVDSAGVIYTLHDQEQVVRMFDRDGTALGSFGGRGGGPGEFEGAGLMGWAADTLWVLDYDGYRFSRFSAGGRYLGSFSVPFGSVPGLQAVQPPRASGLLDDGRVHGMTPAFSHQIVEGIITHQQPVLMSRAGEVTDSLPSVPIGRMVWGVQRPDGRGGFYMTQPFGDSPLWGYARGEDAIYVVDRDASPVPSDARFHVTKIGFGGDTIFSRAYAYEALPVRREEVDSIVRARAELLADAGYASGAEALRLSEEALYAPAHRPPVVAFVVARDGAIWLQLTVPPSERAAWLVLDPDGETLARVELPARLRLHVVDPPLLWGVEADELDVPYVVRYRVGRG